MKENQKYVSKSVVITIIVLALVLPGSAMFTSIEETINKNVSSSKRDNNIDLQMLNDTNFKESTNENILTEVDNSIDVQMLNNDVTSDESVEETSDALDSVDWWPMSRHDAQHTGFSTSTGPETNNVLWSFTVTSNNIFRSCPAVVDNRVYLGSEEGIVYCLNAFTGNIIWAYDSGDGGNSIDKSSPAVADGKVYIGLDSKFICLNADTGDLIWDSPASNVRSSSTVVDDKVYFGDQTPSSPDYQGKIYCLNAITGVEIWSYPTIGRVYGTSPAVVDGRVFIGSCDYYEFPGRFYCLNATTGVEIWNHTTTVRPVLDASPAVADGMVYIGADNKFYCFNATTGDIIWEYATRVSTSPVIAYGKVFIHSRDDQNLYCLDAVTGDYIWNLYVGLMRASPSVADGKLYIAGLSGTMFCLNATTSDYIWSYINSWTESSPTIALGKVYVGVGEYELCCFGTPDHDVGVISIDSPVNGPAVVITPEVTVENYGLNNEIDVPVNMVITKIGTDVEYNETVNININAGETQVVTFPDWTPEDLGLGTVGVIDYTVTSSTHLETDAFPDNDGETKTITLIYEDASPILSVSVAGGLGVTATVTNTGGVDATNVNVEFTATGGLMLWPPDGQTKVIDTVAKDGCEGTAKCMVFGFGKPTIVVNVSCDEGATANETYNPRFVFLIFVL